MAYCTDCELEVSLSTAFRCLSCGGGRTIPAASEMIATLPTSVRAERMQAAVDALEARRGKPQHKET